MAYTSQAEIQTAMYNMLVPSGTLDTTLSSLGLNAVYDLMNVPQNAPFDYLTLGDGYEVAKDTLGLDGHSNGFQCYTTLHLWSTQNQTQNIDLMIDRIVQLFHRQALTLQTLNHVSTRTNRIIRMIDPSGTFPVFHAAIQFLIYTVQQ